MELLVSAVQQVGGRGLTRLFDEGKRKKKRQHKPPKISSNAFSNHKSTGLQLPTSSSQSNSSDFPFGALDGVHIRATQHSTLPTATEQNSTTSTSCLATGLRSFTLIQHSSRIHTLLPPLKNQPEMCTHHDGQPISSELIYRTKSLANSHCSSERSRWIGV